MARLTLEVTSVEEPKPFGKQGAQQVRFKAKGEDGKELQYFTTARSLFPSIVLGPLDCDVDITQREWEGNTYTDRKVSQVYKDGQPVKAEGFGEKGGGQRSYGKPIENVQYERASIEFNNAMSEVGHRVSEGKAPSDIEAAYWGHLRRLLRVGLQEAHDATTQAIITTAQMYTKPTFLDMRAEVPPNAVVAGEPKPPSAPPEGRETASAPIDHIPGRSEDERAALLQAGEGLKWTGNVSTGDGQIRPGKEWWEKFAQAADMAKVKVALENARKMLEEYDDE